MSAAEAAAYGLTEVEYKIIKEQICRRKIWREKFLKLRTDPALHSAGEGFVFDSSIQRFISMKTLQYELFEATPKTALFGIFAIIVPMATFGYFVYQWRANFEEACRTNKIKYRDRINKFT